MRELIADGLIQGDAWASVRRITIGFGISVLIAIPLGLAMGTFKSMEALFEPAIGFIRYMPATAFVILLIFWLGLGEPPEDHADRHRHRVLQHADDRERCLAGADRADQGCLHPRRGELHGRSGA